MWFVLWRRCFRNWNNLAAIRAVDCDVPLVGLNGFTHRLPQIIPTLQRCSEPRLARLSQPLLGASNQLQYPVGVWPSHRFLPKPPRRWMAGLPWAQPSPDCAHLLCRKGGGGSRSLSVGVNNAWGSWGAQSGPCLIHIAHLARRPLYVRASCHPNCHRTP